MTLAFFVGDLEFAFGEDFLAYFGLIVFAEGFDQVLLFRNLALGYVCEDGVCLQDFI